MAVALGAASVSSAVLTVSKSGGMFSTVQSAVDAAQSGDEIVIRDLGVYEEQVTIDSTKKNLVLKSENPQSLDKPVIKWLDDENVGPRNFEETWDPEKITYSKNGALRIIKAKGIVVDGLIIDGGEPSPYAYPSVWNGQNELFSGNSALLLNAAGEVIIKNCEMRNAYYGIHLADHLANRHYFTEDGLQVSGVGNHIIEHNRIHSNSHGILFQTVVGSGSTVRFNLFYNNFHTEAVLSAISNFPGKDHEVGGALMLKDVCLTPIAVHNNTFWNNYLTFAGHWKPGSQHLLFNNIYGKPKFYWRDGYQTSDDYTNPWLAMDGCFANRSKNCLYAAQAQAPKTRRQTYEISCLGRDTTITGVAQVNISNEIPDSYVAAEGSSFVFESTGGTCGFTVPWMKNPGALISDPELFPAEAEMRWFEVEFLSTDPSDPDFLKPDWGNTDVQNFIQNKGWTTSGIVNSEGENADIGAIQSGGYPCGSIVVFPSTYFSYDHNSGTADLDFFIKGDEQVSDLEISYLNLVSNVPVQSSSAFGSTVETVSASDIHALDIPATAVQMGENSLQLQLPAALGQYAFIEMVVTGRSTDGKSVVSNVAFMPFRQDVYNFTVEVYDSTGTKKISSIVAGSRAVLKVSSEAYTEVIENAEEPIQISLRNSKNKWYTENVNSVILDTIVFTSAGWERVSVDGYSTLGYELFKLFHGVSEPIEVTYAQASSITFVGPPSDFDPPIKFEPDCTVKVFCEVLDEYGNRIDGPASIIIESLDPEIASVIVWNYMYSIATADVNIKTSAVGETFRLVARLDDTGASDTLFCITSDAASPVIIKKKIQTPEMFSIQLIDLRGRTVDRFTGTLTDYQDRIRRTRAVSGRGVYLMKVTDLETGKKSVHRLVGQKLRNAALKLK